MLYEFTIPQERILPRIRDLGLLREPQPMRIPMEMRDSGMYCEFHREVGHTTARCKNLYRQLKAVMAKGKLLECLKKKSPLSGRNFP